MMPDLGNYITGATVWFAISFIAGVAVATTTNLAGAFGDKDKRRGPLDWLIWVGIATATFWVVGQGVWWGIHAGRLIHNGAFLPGSG